jgi:DNA-binding transcriptional MocR family regulator
MTHWLPDLAGRTGPRYRAIAEAIADDIQAGRLPVGARLPTHRDLAWRLGVTVGTVTRAYKEVTARGLVDGEIGRGTFVRDPRTHGWGRTGESEPAPIDMGLNFPTEMAETEAALRDTLREIAADPRDMRLAAYDPNGGRLEHRAVMADWIADQGVEASAETTLITAGAQHAISSALQALTEPGDVVLCDPLTHPGFISVASALRLRPVGVDWDGEGMDPDALDGAIRHHRPKAAFLIPTVHNPTARTLPLARRRDIAAVLAHHGLPTIEDDIYRPFADAGTPPPLAGYAPEQVLYVTSASKHLSPGLRIGALHMPPRLRARGRAAIRNTIWMATPLSAEVVARWMRDGMAERLSESKRRAHLARMTMARRILGERIGACADASPHVWLRVPEIWSGEDPAAALLARGVVTTVGEVFATQPGAGRGHIRLALGRPDRPEDVEAGLRLIAEVLTRDPSVDTVFL